MLGKGPVTRHAGGREASNHAEQKEQKIVPWSLRTCWLRAPPRGARSQARWTPLRRPYEEECGPPEAAADADALSVNSKGESAIAAPGQTLSTLEMSAECAARISMILARPRYAAMCSGDAPSCRRDRCFNNLRERSDGTAAGEDTLSVMSTEAPASRSATTARSLPW